MLARSHLIAAAAAYAGAVQADLLPLAMGPAVACLIGGLAPDLDHPRSTAGRVLPWLSAPLAATFGHRGALHSLLGFALAAAAAFWLAQTFWLPDALALAFAVGYLSHLAADALTYQGIPILWPTRSRLALGLVRTGGTREAVVVGLMLAGLGAWALPRLPLPALAG